MDRNGPFVGGFDEFWEWDEAPKVPPSKRTEPDELARNGQHLSPLITEYLRWRDGKLQQLWTYKHTSGQHHSFEWIDVPTV